MQQQLEQTVVGVSGSPAVAIADAAGNATFTFPAVPQGQTWWGSVQIEGAPFSAVFAAVVSVAGIGNAGTPWGTWQGPLPYSMVRAEGRQQVIVNATGLTPGVQFAATWLGIMDDSLDPVPEFPAPLGPSANFPTAPLIRSTFTDALGSHTTALFPVSNVKGARFSFRNAAGSAGNPPTVVTLSWYSLGSPGTNPIAQRLIVLAQAGGSAHFQHPHLGDFLQVTASSTNASPLNLDVEIANVDDDRLIWHTIGAPAGNPLIPEELGNFTGVLGPASGLTVINATFSNVFAGPVHFHYEPDSNPGATPAGQWQVKLQAQGISGAWETIAAWDNNTQRGVSYYTGAEVHASNVNVAPGATTQLIGAPVLGTGYRIKSLTSTALLAPAAGVRNQFQGVSDGHTLAIDLTTATAGVGISVFPDIPLNDGVQYVNNTGVNYRVSVVAEVVGIQTEGAGVNELVIVPPGPLRVLASNNDAFAHTIALTLIADSYRA